MTPTYSLSKRWLEESWCTNHTDLPHSAKFVAMYRSCPDPNHDPDPDSPASLASNIAHATNVGIVDRIQDKQSEYDHLCHVREMSAQLVLYFEELANCTEGMANGVQVIAKVMSNWNNVFGVMGLAGEQTSKKPPSDNTGNQNVILGDEQSDYPSSMLVRIPRG